MCRGPSAHVSSCPRVLALYLDISAKHERYHFGISWTFLRPGSYHCMTSTSSPARKVRVFRAVYGVALSFTSVKILCKFALAQRMTFWCTMAMYHCWLTVPSTTTICDLPNAWKAPIPWGKGRHFHQFLGCNSPLVSHQHADGLGHDHHSGKGWIWTHQQISHGTSALMVTVPVPACPYAASVAMIMSQSVGTGWTSRGITSCYQTSLDRVGRNTTSKSA